MVLIQEMAAPLFKEIIDWALLIMWILLFVKLIQIFTHMKHKDKDGTTKKDKTDPYDPTKKENKPVYPEKVKTEAEKNAEKLKEAGLDPDNMMKVDFQVIDNNGNPVLGAKLKTWPFYKDKKIFSWFEKNTKYLKNIPLGTTLPNGFTPSPETLPAGRWTLEVEKRMWQIDKEVTLGWFLRQFKTVQKFIRAEFLNSKKHKNVIPYYVSPDTPEGETQVVPIKLKQINSEDGFTPYIIDICQIDKKAGERRLRMRGQVN